MKVVPPPSAEQTAWSSVSYEGSSGPARDSHRFGDAQLTAIAELGEPHVMSLKKPLPLCELPHPAKKTSAHPVAVVACRTPQP